ncbi:hypothetical protein QBC37DRAFT_49754 [Rhypophila decipiens]|uniref:Uncharacterized protein n=1 Tax=Rhypophila decipiens TaxID=261697 RepID=A0AAN6XZR3_9PEZI|nr:hypothetical protein QBC37DRAFT_49754 [Rhypophila decipiens]
MMFITLTWALVAILWAGFGVATPVLATVTPVQTTQVAASITALANPYPTAAGGALDPNPANPKIGIEPGPETYTVIISNAAGRPFSTVHHIGSRTDQPPFPTLINNPQPGRLENGATGLLKIPRRWEGNMAFGEARFGVPGSWVSLFEGSYKEDENVPGLWRFAVDVSFVAGYTAPMVCYCGQADEAHRLKGCKEPLFEKNTCPADFVASLGVCRNPKQSFKDTDPTPFFAPCRGHAYTCQNIPCHSEGIGYQKELSGNDWKYW